MKLAAGRFIILFFLYYLMAFFLGYTNINNRFHADSEPPIVDAHVYRNIAKDGIAAVDSDHRSGRFLIPFLAHGIYQVLPSEMGPWDVPLLSLLLVNSLFVAGMAVLFVVFSLQLGFSAMTGFVASLLFLLNFAVVHFYLAGLVDAGEGFCIFLLAYLLYKEKWSSLPFLAILGVLIKETFIASSCALIFTWILVECYQTRKFVIPRFIWFGAFVLLGLVVFTITKSVSNGQFLLPWEYVHNIRFHDTWKSPTLSKIANEILRFSYVYIWLVPLAVFHLKKFPQTWVYATWVSTLTMFALNMWVGVDGSAMSRYLFITMGPLLCLSASVYVSENLLRKL